MAYLGHGESSHPSTLAEIVPEHGEKPQDWYMTLWKMNEMAANEK